MSERAPAAELSDALAWVNAEPQRVRAQRGRVVLLAFWHAGQAISQNLFDELRPLMARHGDSITLLGIHSPKFEHERDAAIVLKAVNRLGLRFPVASDPDLVTWQHYGVTAWPSVAVIDASARLVCVQAGEAQRDSLTALVETLLDEALTEDNLVYESLPEASKPEPRLPLLFPAGLAASKEFLYIVDSGHHRVLECSHDGRVQRQFGSGNAGLVDGRVGEAGFNLPRGIALLDDVLYVADTGNHALRRIRLGDGHVDTLMGNGRPGRAFMGRKAEPAAGVAPNLPWDVVGHFDRLYLSMAGIGQAWEFNLAEGRVRALAGSGKLALEDGVGLAASFGQPAGLALHQQTLYVADAAASAIRSVHVSGGQVQTLVGQGLYDFGDQDGLRGAARLQCPQAICPDARSPLLWVADTFNDAIRTFRFGGGELRRFDPDHRLHEPGGLAALPGLLFVANSAAHEVLRVDIEAGSTRRLPVDE